MSGMFLRHSVIFTKNRTAYSRPTWVQENVIVPVGRWRCSCRRAKPIVCSDAETRRTLWPWAAYSCHWRYDNHCRRCSLNSSASETDARSASSIRITLHGIRITIRISCYELADYLELELLVK